MVTPEHTISFQGMAPLLQVFDMSVSLWFYRDVLQFRVLQSSGEGDTVDWVLLQQGSIEIMLNAAYEKDLRPATLDPKQKEAHGDTALHFGCPNVEVLYTYLLGKGIVATKPEMTGYGWKALYLTDPDGYQLCFHWPEEV